MTTRPKQANLLIVFPDQMRGSAMGFLGEEPVRTPVLDRAYGGSVEESVTCETRTVPWKAPVGLD